MSPSQSKLTLIGGLILVILLGLLVLTPTLFNGWVNWDDDQYVLKNSLIQQLSIGQIREMFQTLQVQGNYHPLTLLSLSLDYRIGGADPFVFHLVNLCLHLLNTGLVLGFIYLLTKRIYIALITALLFGIHPMHVESVAWISERKDVLYTFFFLGGLILYLTYLKGGKRKYIWLSVCGLTFILSLLSKGMAVTFPVILLLVDYLKKRTDYRQLFLEKAPLFALSIGAGILTIIAQRAGQALSHAPEISFFESLITASYGLSMYTVKAIIPFHLSALHPYPMKGGEALPSVFYISSLSTVIFLYLAYLGNKKNREIGFGVGVYLTSLGPVLQVLPVGNAVIAERYTYIAYIGLFFLLGWAIDQILRSGKAQIQWRKVGIIIILGIYVGLMIGVTRMRIPVWKNGETLWTDVIEKYPDHYFAYSSRAMYWVEQGMPDKALADFQETLIRNPQFVEAYINRGLLYAQDGEYENALADYNEAILLDSLNYLPFLNRGAVLRLINQPQEALLDLNQSIMLNPNFAMSYHNRGIVHRQLRQFPSALQDFSAALKITPDNPSLWFERGWVRALSGNLPSAIQDFSRAIELKASYPEAYFFRSMAYLEQGEKERALEDAKVAESMGFEVEKGFWEKVNLK